jgi:ribose 5-phosphate isomerase
LQWLSTRYAGASCIIVENSVISGNGYGVFITDPGTAVVDVAFDQMGTDATGTINLGNSLDGVVVQGGATGVFIVYNTIANSGGWGLVIACQDAIGPNTFFNNADGNELLE